MRKLLLIETATRAHYPARSRQTCPH